jgi:hypothetical protein
MFQSFFSNIFQKIYIAFRKQKLEITIREIDCRVWEVVANYLIETGGWAHFNVPNKLSLKAYSQVINFAEANNPQCRF